MFLRIKDAQVTSFLCVNYCLITHGFISSRYTIYFFHERNQSVMRSVSFSALLDPQIVFLFFVLILVSLVRSSRISLLSFLRCTDRSFSFMHVVLSPDLQISRDDRPYHRGLRRRAARLKLAPGRFADKDTCHGCQEDDHSGSDLRNLPGTLFARTFTPWHSVSTLRNNPLSLCTPADFTNRSLPVLCSSIVI